MVNEAVANHEGLRSERQNQQPAGVGNHRLNKWRNEQWRHMLKTLDSADLSQWETKKTVMGIPTPSPPNLQVPGKVVLKIRDRERPG